MFNPMNWLILKPTTIGEVISPEYSSVEKNDAYDKDVRSKSKSRTYNKTNKYNRRKGNKTKYARKRK
tara:strand:- start:12850 stop:13050 length:201 start_codon:yes stop_codon:yes gene_type:complete